MENKILEFRTLETDDNSLKIRALVNNYKPSKMLKNKKGQSFIEVAPKEMWEKCISDDVKIFVNHKDYYNVGISHKFDIKDDGVYLEIELDRVKEKGIYENVKNGILNQISFGFNAISDKWDKIGNYFQRTLENINLKEISLLDCTAAYNGTAIECRNIDVPVNNDVLLMRMKLDIEKLR